MRLGSWIPFSAWMDATVTPKCPAIELSVSPNLTVYVRLPTDGDGRGVGGGFVGRVVGLAEGRGVAEAVGKGVGDGVSPGLSEGVGRGLGDAVGSRLGALPTGADDCGSPDTTGGTVGRSVAPDAPKRAMAIAAKATIRSATRITWPLVRLAPGSENPSGTTDRGRSSSTGTVEGTGRRDAGPGSPMWFAGRRVAGAGPFTGSPVLDPLSWSRRSTPARNAGHA